MVTGLLFYGARYYDPRTSVWQSPDPIMGSYLTGKPNGGVFRPNNLNLFAYTYQNPVKYIDPSGQYITADPERKSIKFTAVVHDDSSNPNVDARKYARRLKKQLTDSFVRAGVRRENISIDIIVGDNDYDDYDYLDDDGNPRNEIIIVDSEDMPRGKSGKLGTVSDGGNRGTGGTGRRSGVGGTRAHLNADKLWKRNTRGQRKKAVRTEAHEVLHLFGLKHTDRVPDDNLWNKRV